MCWRMAPKAKAWPMLFFRANRMVPITEINVTRIPTMIMTSSPIPIVPTVAAGPPAITAGTPRTSATIKAGMH